MRKAALMTMATLAGAGAGLLMFTQTGRGLVILARRRLMEGGSRTQPAEIVQEALGQPHADTAMAHAFEEAISG
jgi:hypothetical protein